MSEDKRIEKMTIIARQRNELAEQALKHKKQIFSELFIKFSDSPDFIASLTGLVRQINDAFTELEKKYEIPEIGKFSQTKFWARLDVIQRILQTCAHHILGELGYIRKSKKRIGSKEA